MDLQCFLEEALQRGEHIKSKVLEDVFQNRLINRLLKNEKFLNTVVSLLNAKADFEKRIHRKVNALFKLFEIPTREEIRGMESKIHRLENEIETIHRKMLTRSLRRKAAKAVTHHKKR
jgi:hypothetical protein